MAERRMFAKTIIDSDAFLDMPLSSQALYFHLSMRADDDGFINNPKKIQRMVGASDDDLKLLVAKRFIIPFESGIVVIKHWKIHNYIRCDRYKETMYQKEKAMLAEKENRSYTLAAPCEPCLPSGIPTDNQMDAQDRKGQERIEKDKDIYISVISYLNEKAGTQYRHSTKNTQTKISALLKDGFTLDDFKTVIDKKCAEWLNTDMAKFLRPETLFNAAKFENYLNAKTGARKAIVPTVNQDDLDDIF